MAEYFEAGIINVLDRDTNTYHKLLAIKGEPGEPGPVASEEVIRQVTSDEIAKIIGEAPESFDTLKEISDWINTHEDSASAMNTDIQANKADIAELKTKKAVDIPIATITEIPTIENVQSALTTLSRYIASLQNDRDDINDIIDTTIFPALNTLGNVATQSAKGQMSSADKTKLDGIAANANNYSLPKASESILGGIKIGPNLSINSDGIVTAYDTTYGVATQLTNGLMSASDKTKLDGIASGANAYSLPTASSSKLGGIKVGTNLSISNGVLSAVDTTYSAATQSAQGLMSAADKKKLDGIATGATAVTSSTVSGWGFKTTDTTYSNATQSANGLMSASDKKKLDGIASGANAYSLPAASAGALGGIKVSLSGTTLYIST